MIYAAIAVVLTWVLWMPLHFYFKRRGRKIVALIFKVIPTLCAAAFAGYAHFALKQTDAYPELIFYGLCICALADWMLGVRFEVGGALFFIGHVFYVVAFSLYRALSWWSLTVFVLALGALWFFLSHYRDKIPNKLIGLGLCVYCAALAALLGFGLPLPFLAFSRRAVFAALGAALFVASDLTLCHNTARQKPDTWHFCSLGVYYMAQFMLGFSAFPNL